MINQKRLVQAFLELVQIDSPSEFEEKIAEELTKRLKNIGASVEKDRYSNIIAKIAGTGEPLMLNCHMDTVEPGRNIKPHIKGDRIESDGSTILGGDAKAGLAIILEALTSLKEEKTKHIPIEIVFTVQEETGLLGAINLDYSKVTAKRGITFDGTKDVANITISAPGYNRVDVTITGRAAHAGARPEKGISAIKIAAEIISQLQLGRIDHETTANIGLITGGSARNAIPETVHFKGEIRSRNIKKIEKHSLHFEKTFSKVLSKYPEAKIDLLIHREFNPYLFEENHEVIEFTKKTFKKMGLKITYDHSGGGSDVNIFHSHGIQAVAVGIGDYEAHTKQEYVVIPEMVQAARFCEQLVKNIDK